MKVERSREKINRSEYKLIKPLRNLSTGELLGILILNYFTIENYYNIVLAS